MKRLTVGSRGSKLAMTQTKWVASHLDCEVDVKEIVTRGDKITDVALAKLEGKAFFTKEIDDALLNKSVDFAVHSFKDVPTELEEGLIIASIPIRESPRDAMVSKYTSLDELPQGAKVGTASLRRRAQVLKARPDVEVLDLRGNLDTRVRKQNEGQYDAIIVAEAGLRRLGYTDYHALDEKEFIPASCQGALAITAREGDAEVLESLMVLEDKETRIACMCERTFLTALEGGCQIPAGAYARISPDSGRVSITGFISSVDGKRFITGMREGTLDEAVAMSASLAEELLSLGGRELLDEIRRC